MDLDSEPGGRRKVGVLGTFDFGEGSRRIWSRLGGDIGVLTSDPVMDKEGTGVTFTLILRPQP